MTPLDHALKRAASGIPVFPCRPNDETVNGKLYKAKSPRTPHGFKDASTDPAQIRQWFTDSDSLVAIPTGKASGLVVVDVDPDGLAYADARIDWGNPRVQTTRRGGKHYIYNASPGVEYITDTNVLAPGVDVRGEGGYIVDWEGEGLPTTGEPCDVPATLAPEIIRKPRAKQQSVDVTPVDWERLRQFLTTRDPDASEFDWVRDIWAVHHITNGSDAGLDLVDEWSSTGKKYKGRADVAYKWDHAERDGGITGRRIGYEPPLEFSPLPPVDDIDLSDEGPKLKFPVTRFSDLVTYNPLPYLIRGFMPRAPLGIVFGQSGSGKTFLVSDAALKIAAGLTWRHRKTQQGRVVYICAEGAGGFRMRAKAFADHYRVPLESIPFFAILASPNLMQAPDAKQVVESIKSVGGADLVVIDTLAATTPGADENTGKDMGLALKHCGDIHAATGATVLLVHHSGKDQTRGARGWSGLNAGADFVIEVTSTDSMRFAQITKMKDGEQDESFAFVLESAVVGYDEDDLPITSCIVKDIELTQTAKRKPRGQFQCQVFDAIQSLAKGNSPPSVATTEVLENVSCGMAFEPEKRDTRGQQITRAIKSLAADAFIYVSNNIITVCAE